VTPGGERPAALSVAYRRVPTVGPAGVFAGSVGTRPDARTACSSCDPSLNPPAEAGGVPGQGATAMCRRAAGAGGMTSVLVANRWRACHLFGAVVGETSESEAWDRGAAKYPASVWLPTVL
jgi:hypothetical protein